MPTRLAGSAVAMVAIRKLALQQNSGSARQECCERATIQPKGTLHSGRPATSPPGLTACLQSFPATVSRQSCFSSSGDARCVHGPRTMHPPPDRPWFSSSADCLSCTHASRHPGRFDGDEPTNLTKGWQHCSFLTSGDSAATLLASLRDPASHATLDLQASPCAAQIFIAFFCCLPISLCRLPWTRPCRCRAWLDI